MDLNISEYLNKHLKNDKKTLPNLFKYLGKIKSTADYYEYKNEYLIKPLINWFFELQISALLFFAVIVCLSASFSLGLTLSQMIMMAEGISILRFLVIDFKEDIWRNRK
jgi:hypothetical protein